jgi:hypothetical protein
MLAELLTEASRRYELQATAAGEHDDWNALTPTPRRAALR